MNSNELENKTAWVLNGTKKHPDKIKKLGRIRAMVFHPDQIRLVGFLVKRPDIAWMFRRDDSFVAFDGFEVMEDDKGNETIVVKDEASAIGKGALKRLGVKLDECLLWIGLEVLCENKQSLGTVDSVEFDPNSGKVEELLVSKGATANTLLGKRKIPASKILGFRKGVGSRLNLPETMDEDEMRGAIVVDNDSATLEVDGGVAQAAGKASAIAIDKAKKTTSEAKEKIAPVIKGADKAVQKGAYATGRQIARTEGMFKGFKDEFKKAMNGEEDS